MAPQVVISSHPGTSVQLRHFKSLSAARHVSISLLPLAPALPLPPPASAGTISISTLNFLKLPDHYRQEGKFYDFLPGFFFFFFSPGGGGGQRGASPKSRLSGWAVAVAPLSRHLIGWMYFQQAASAPLWLTREK